MFTVAKVISRYNTVLNVYSRMTRNILYTFVVLLLSATGCRLITLGQSTIYKDPEPLVDNWEYRREFSKQNCNRGDSNWQKVTLPLPHIKKQSNTIWLRTTLPATLPKRPSLYIRELYLSVVVYVDNMPIYSFILFGSLMLIIAKI